MVSSIGSSTTTLALRSLTATSTRPSPPDPQEMFSRLDTDGDGKVTLAELQAGAPPAARGQDGTQDGSRTATQAANGAGPPSPERMLQDLDGDGDGVVTYEEFAAWRPAEPPTGPPPGRTGSGAIDIAALFDQEQDDSGSLLARLA